MILTTLRREVREECGAELSHIGEEIGAVVEYDHDTGTDFDAFKMTSHYYRCEVADILGAQKLDGCERDLGFTPVWVAIEEAMRSIRHCRRCRILQSGCGGKSLFWNICYVLGKE